MATRKSNKTPLEEFWPARLRITKDKFESILNTRIEFWNDILNINITNREDYEKVKEEYYKRDNWNRELLQQSFSYENNKYYDEYTSWWPTIIWMWEPNLHEKITDLKEDIIEKINKLETLLNKIELIPIEENINQNSNNQNDNIHYIKNILHWFHKCAQELRYRYSNRETILINDEYDVQDLLRSILKIYFNDVRAEDYSPSSAGGNSRIDLVLPIEWVIIETKMTSERLKDKEVWEQIAIDIVRYQNHPSFNKLIVFIYDKWDFIRNKRWLIVDLEKQSRSWKEVIVVINPD